MITHVRIATIHVRDQEAAKRFFLDKLGFELRRDDAMGTPGEQSPRWIEVAPRGAETALVLFTPPGTESRIGSMSGVVFSCDDCDTTAAELVAKGVDVFEAPKKQPWGGTMAQFKDADGNSYVLVSTSEAR